MCSVLGLSWPQLGPHGPHTCHSLCLDYSARLFTWRTLRSQLKYDMSRGGSFGQLATLGPHRNMCPVLYPRGTLLFPLWPIPPFEIPPCLGDGVFQSCLLYGTVNSARTPCLLCSQRQPNVCTLTVTQQGRWKFLRQVFIVVSRAGSGEELSELYPSLAE